MIHLLTFTVPKSFIIDEMRETLEHTFKSCKYLKVGQFRFWYVLFSHKGKIYQLY